MEHDKTHSSDPVVDAYRAGIDETLLRENLHRSVDERFLNLMEMQRFAAELQHAARILRQGK